MPRLSECPEWRLLQSLARALEERKARSRPSVQGWRNEINNIESHCSRMLETELRKTFIPRESNVSLTEEDFRSFRLKLREVCCLLEGGVNPLYTKKTGKTFEFRWLSSTVEFLNCLVDDGARRFDLVSGPNERLFRIEQQQDRQEEWLQCITDCNKSIEEFFDKGLELSSAPIFKLKDHVWRDSRLRNHASATFRLLFEQFTCNASHEILMRFIQPSTDEQRRPDLQLLLSSCTGTDDWQEIQCNSGDYYETGRELDSLCSEIEQFSNPSQQLHILSEEPPLFGTWALRPGGQPCFRASEKQSLDDMIAKGRFKPITAQSYFDQSSTTRLDLRQKRALAVKLGYCLMDFFDSDLKSSKIHFLGARDSTIGSNNLFLSFSSSLPTWDGLRVFSMRHPVLLSFSKILLELDDGEPLSLNIDAHCGAENDQIWMKFFQYAHHKKSGRNDPYLEALSGCLLVHTQLQSVDFSGPQADLEIREELYRYIVHNLEIALEECSPRSQEERRQSRSLPALCDLGRLGRSERTHSGSRETSIPFRNWRSTERDQGRTPVPEVRANGTLSPAARDRPPNRNSFHIAIVCALQLEHNAMSLLFEFFWDEDGDGYGRATGDGNQYRTGRIGKHDVVLVLLPGMGKANAAAGAIGLRASFPSLSLVLLCGVCGGVPTPKTEPRDSNDIFLGDVIISDAIVQYDLGRQYPGSFETKSDKNTALSRPLAHIRSILNLLQVDSVHPGLQRRTAHFLRQMQLEDKKYRHPGVTTDQLFQAKYRHIRRTETTGIFCFDCISSSDGICKGCRQFSCDKLGCEEEYLVRRNRPERNRHLQDTGGTNEAQAPSIFFGCVGSGDTVLKCGEDRDEMAKKHGCLGFEMEGAGIWDVLPCIVVKGVCDYADSHKNKAWQDFAAATSACVVKALLERYDKTDPSP